MPLPLIPVALVALTGGAYAASRLRKKDLKQEHKIIYESAMQTEKNPAKLRILAQAFRKCGHKAHAEMLEKRARLRALPQDIKDKRRQIFKVCMNESDPAKVEEMAQAFQKDGATGAAQALFQHAEALRKG